MAPDKKSKEDLEKELAELKRKVHALEEETKPSGFELPRIDFKIDDHFKLKAPFLAILFLLFLFSCYLLAKSQVVSSDFFDISRAQLNMTRFLSFNFLAFVLLASISYGLAAFFGYGGAKRHSMFTFIAAGTSAAIMWMMFPDLGLAFFAFAISIASATFFAAAEEKQDLGAANHALSRALTILTVLVFVFSFLVVSGSRDVYFDQFFNNSISFTLSAAPGMIKAGAAIVQSMPEENFQFVKKEDLRSELAKQVWFSALSKAQQDTALEAYYQQVGPQMALQIKTLVVSKLNDAASKPMALDPKTVADIKAKLIHDFPQIYDFFPVIIAVIFVSYISLLKIPLNILSSIVCLLLFKL